MKRDVRLWFSALAVILIGCGDSVIGPERDQSQIQTEAVSYKLERTPGEYRTVVTATYRNNTGSPVYFARCMPEDRGPIYGVRRTGPDSTRMFFTDWAWACVGGVPSGVIPAGESVTLKVRFGSIDQPRMQPPLTKEMMTGTFRIVLYLCTRAVADSDDCSGSFKARAESNAFLVHV